MNDEDIARAQALGRAAARAKQPITSCPYPWDTPDNRVLRMRWALAYARAGGRQGIVGPGKQWLRRVWEGDGKD